MVNSINENRLKDTNETPIIKCLLSVTMLLKSPYGRWYNILSLVVYLLSLLDIN